MTPLISIFIPVYNGEKFLRKTLDSILAQTFRTFEVVCVDDTSTDCSFEILNEYAAKDNRVKCFRKTNGGNVPKSWIFALPHLKGEYLIYCSQDDFISPDLLEKTYSKALECNADATIPELVHYFGVGKDNPSLKGIKGDTTITLTGRQAFLYSLNWDIHAFVLWKADLVRTIGFDDLATNSDEYATRLFFLHSRKVVFSEGIFYYNQTNPEAITTKVSVKRFDWCITNQRLLEVMKAQHFSDGEVASFNYTVWGNTLYQHQIFIRHKHSFDEPEKIKIKQILKQTYQAINWNVIAERYGLKGKVIKMLFANNFILFSLIIPLYSLTIKKEQ